MGVVSLFASTPVKRDTISHRLSVELRPAYNIVSHYALRGDDPLNEVASLHLRYAFAFNELSTHGKLFPTTYQGIGIAGYTFFHPEITGKPIALYIFQGADITHKGDFTFGYEWNFGASWNWRPNDGMNSKWNIMVNVALPLSWQVSPNWKLSLTPDFTHLSNGDTHFSNSGANLFGLRMGVTRLFNDHKERITPHIYIAPAEELQGKCFGERLTHDIMLYGGWRADRFTDNDIFIILNKPLFINGFQLHNLYHFNNHFALGTSLDIQRDSSLNLYDAVFDENGDLMGYTRPAWYDQTECGISLRCEIAAPIFSIGAGFGVNILGHGYDFSRFYTQFSLKAFMNDHCFIFVGYRYNTVQYTHNMMYGLGWRF